MCVTENIRCERCVLVRCNCVVCSDVGSGKAG